MKIEDYFDIRGLKYTQIESFPSTNNKILTLFLVEDPQFDKSLKAGTYYCIIETESSGTMRKIMPYLDELEAKELMKEYFKGE